MCWTMTFVILAWIGVLVKALMGIILFYVIYQENYIVPIAIFVVPMYLCIQFLTIAIRLNELIKSEDT